MTVRSAHDGLVSLAMIAAAANVSISTVSRIVNGKADRFSPETAQRVRDAIATLGYHPNQIGRALKGGRTHIVAMLTANLNNPVMSTIAASTERALRKAGYVMFLCDTHDRANLQDEYLEAMRSQGVDGYVFVTNTKSAGLKRLVDSGDPAVFVSRRNPYGDSSFVGIDNGQAGALGAEFMLSRRLEKICVISPKDSSSVTEERVKGFCRALEDKVPGKAAPTIIKASGPSSHLDVGYAAARQIAATGKWPDGIMCVSDQIAYGVHRGANEVGIRVPDDCVIVSIDGSELNTWLAPWLVSVQVPYQRFGPAVVDQLLKIWKGEPASESLLPHSI